MLDNERLTYSIPEAAAILGISKNLAYKLAKENRLPIPVIKLGKRVVVSRRVVSTLLERLLQGQGEG